MGNWNKENSMKYDVYFQGKPFKVNDVFEANFERIGFVYAPNQWAAFAEAKSYFSKTPSRFLAVELTWMQ